MTTVTNSTFDHFLPQSLNYLVWTNVLALTNGRNTMVWSVRTHPTYWPAEPPKVQWNPRGLMWGMRGLTALSPCWEGEGLSGQVPITALTRRHGYARGHSMGPDCFDTRFAGKKVWFVTANNQLVERRIVREIVRTSREIGILWLTLYAFSVENWKRPKDEVAALMGLLKEYLLKEVEGMVRNNIRLQAIGRLEDLPPDTQQTLRETLEKTNACNGMSLNLALSYGGRS